MITTRLELPFADGVYSFALPIGMARELQDKTGIGPNVLLTRLRDGSFKVDDAPEAIRCGLIGGGLKPVEAKRLVDRYCYERPAAESLPLACAVMMLMLYGAEKQDVGDQETGEPKAPVPTGESTTPESTALER